MSDESNDPIRQCDEAGCLHTCPTFAMERFNDGKHTWFFCSKECAKTSGFSMANISEEKDKVEDKNKDNINHPEHYTSHMSGVECISIVEHMSFCMGNAIKYLWRADEKGKAIEDLEKARWYIDREIERRKRPDQIVLLRETRKT